MWINYNKVEMQENPNKTWSLVGEPRLEHYVIGMPIPPPVLHPESSDDKSVAELPKPNYFQPKTPNPVLEQITKAHHACQVFNYAVNTRVSVKELDQAYKILQINMGQLRLRVDEKPRQEQAKAKLDIALAILKRRFNNEKPFIMKAGVVSNSQGEFEMNSQNMMFDEEGFCCEMGDCPSFTGGQVPTIKCSSCANWFHFECLKLGDQSKLDLLMKEANPFLCRKCVIANPKQGGHFELFDPEGEKDSLAIKFVQDRISDCRMSPQGVVEFKLHWLDTETEREALEPMWMKFEEVKYSLLEDYYEIISENVERFDAVHDEVVPATPKEITACRVTVHTSLPNKRIPIYRVDWANQRNDVEDWRPTWDLNWTLIAEYHLNREGLSETEDEVGNLPFGLQ